MIEIDNLLISKLAVDLKCFGLNLEYEFSNKVDRKEKCNDTFRHSGFK